MKKQTPFGELEIFDSHTHFFSHNFFSMLAKQSPDLRAEANPVEKIGEMTGFQMPPENPRDLAKIWVEELDKNQFTIVFRNLGFAVATVILRLALTAPPFVNVSLG